MKREKSVREQKMLERLDKGKEKVREEQRKVRWRKDPGTWSSVQEPDLSPIAGSARSCEFHELIQLRM